MSGGEALDKINDRENREGWKEMKKIGVFNFEDLDNVEGIYKNYACAMGKRRKEIGRAHV